MQYLYKSYISVHHAIICWYKPLIQSCRNMVQVFTPTYSSLSFRFIKKNISTSKPAHIQLKVLQNYYISLNCLHYLGWWFSSKHAVLSHNANTHVINSTQFRLHKTYIYCVITESVLWLIYEHEESLLRLYTIHIYIRRCKKKHFIMKYGQPAYYFIVSQSLP